MTEEANHLIHAAEVDEVDRAIVRFIQDHVRQHQRPPTLHAVAHEVHRSHQAIRLRYRKLAGLGILKVTPRESRGVQVVRDISQ